VTTQLEDGRYDAFVLWADKRDGAAALECTITTDVHRGEVIAILASELAGTDEFALVGLPCTLVVSGERVHVEMS
jgi:hypothetical protein